MTVSRGPITPSAATCKIGALRNENVARLHARLPKPYGIREPIRDHARPRTVPPAG
ncbi:MAG TPA: hypothetical protein VFH76_17845 [Kribbella sp.]|nr:hypothetical protein [Kribbella sp.]